jgi:hypothetical protein
MNKQMVISQHIDFFTQGLLKISLLVYQVASIKWFVSAGMQTDFVAIPYKIT